MLALLVVASARPGPSDPLYDQQWGLHRIRVAEAWVVSQGEGVVVAVVDSGVDPTHPDLADSFARRSDGSVLGYDFIEDDDDPTDEHGHGTMVAGIVAAQTANRTGVASVAPGARIMPVRVLDSRGLGTTSDVEAGIRWAVKHGAQVINLSLEFARGVSAGTEPARLRVSSLDRIVRYAWSRGVVVVAAAGNDSAELTDYPSDSPLVLVGATNERDEPAGFSAAGRLDALMAPGVDIVSTWCSPCGSRARHRIGQSEGTSYAAAYVTGAVALMRAAGFGPTAALSRLRQTARDIVTPGPDMTTGQGRIDVAAALGLPAPAEGRGAAGGDFVSQQTDSALAPGSSRSPRVVLEPSATRPGAGTTGMSPESTTAGETGSVRSWALLAAALLLTDVAVLLWVTVHDQFAPRQSSVLMLLKLVWRRAVDFVRLLRG